MNDNININNTLKQLNDIFVLVEEVLTAWTDSGNLQFSTLLGKLAIKMNFDEKQIRQIDPIIRYYIHNNTNYDVVRGAHGGITRVTDKQKKEETKLAKDMAKKIMADALETKTAISNVKDQSEDLETEDYLFEEEVDPDLS